jgi:hypothetical protein
LAPGHEIAALPDADVPGCGAVLRAIRQQANNSSIDYDDKTRAAMKKASTMCWLFSVWCPGEDSNLHGVTR